jgi:hypothetical protein
MAGPAGLPWLAVGIACGSRGCSFFRFSPFYIKITITRATLPVSAPVIMLDVYFNNLPLLFARQLHQGIHVSGHIKFLSHQDFSCLSEMGVVEVFV